MQLIDLAFEYDIEIDYEGDFDGGNYYVTLKYQTATNAASSDTITILTLKQTDIELLYSGAKKLIGLLSKHVQEI
jgi:hypothetical protein